MPPLKPISQPFSGYPECDAYYLRAVIEGRPILRACKIIDFESPTVWVIPSSHTNSEAIAVHIDHVYYNDQVKVCDKPRRKTVELTPEAKPVTLSFLEDLLGPCDIRGVAI